jgi:hypothetical protein
VLLSDVKGLVRAVAVAITVAGCAIQTVAVRGAPEQVPLAQRHDARVLVHYAPAVREAQYSDAVVEVAIGAASIERLDQAFQALFSSVTQVSVWPPWSDGLPAVDGVIEVDEAGVEVVRGVRDLPSSSALHSLGTPHQVTVHYDACLYRPDGAKVDCWEAESLSERQLGFFASEGASVAALADQAMTDAVAKLMRALELDPAVQAWLAQPAVSGRAVSVTARIAILAWPLQSVGFDEEGEVAGCLKRSLGAELPGIEFVGRSRVRAALYPLLQPSTEPKTEEEFARLLARGDVQTRLRELGLGYLIAFAGGTRDGETRGLAECGYMGCTGFVWQSEESRLDAVMWPLGGEPRAQSMSAAAQGTNFTPFVVFPIPIPARTLDEACAQLGRKVAETIKTTVMPPP